MCSVRPQPHRERVLLSRRGLDQACRGLHGDAQPHISQVSACLLDSVCETALSQSLPQIMRITGAHSIDGHPLSIDELRGTTPADAIHLSGKRLGVASGIIIAACIKGNEQVKSLKCALHPRRNVISARAGPGITVPEFYTLVLAVSTATRFPSTSCEARSPSMRSTSQTRVSASLPASSSQRASKATSTSSRSSARFSSVRHRLVSACLTSRPSALAA